VTGGSDYIVENNLIDQSRSIGIETTGAGSIVRRNNVVNTVGSSGQAYAIYAEGDVIDNVVDGVSGADSLVNFSANGIYSPTDAGVNLGISIRGNRIRNLTPKGTGEAIGISSLGSGVSVRDNVIAEPAATTGFGISCMDSTSHVRDNVILNYGADIQAACDNAGGNSLN
jgi:hypothetical protein